MGRFLDEIYGDSWLPAIVVGIRSVDIGTETIAIGVVVVRSVVEVGVESPGVSLRCGLSIPLGDRVDKWGDYGVTIVVDIGVVSEGVANTICKRNNSLGSLNFLGLSLFSLLSLVNNRVDIGVVKSIGQWVESTVGYKGVSFRVGLGISSRLSFSLAIRVNSWAVVAIVVWAECIVVGGGVVVEVVV